MPKLTGIKKINIAVFISGNGSNLKSLILDSFKKKSKYEIKLVISNKETAKGLKYAKKFKIKKKIILNLQFIWNINILLVRLLQDS